MRFNRSFINVIGCGYAGIECALFLAGHGHKVHIFDACKEYKDYCNDCDFAKKREVNEALLSRELSLLGSPLIKAEEQLLLKGYNKKDLPEILLEIGKDMIKHNENIEYFEACVHEINPKEVTIIATGPNTDKKMFDFLLKQFGSMRCFSHMPVYPVLKKIDESRLLQKEFDDEFLYLPLNYQEYINFINHIVKGLNEEIDEKDFKLVENTMEDLVDKGKDNLKNYAMMPVLLKEINEKPYAVLKLRKTEKGFRIEEISSKFDLINQMQVFSSLNGFENSIIVKKADALDICFLNSRYVVNQFHQCFQNENIFFAGSILGITGYVDCIASGLYTALNVNKYFSDKQMIPLPRDSCIGMLAKRIVSSASIKPQPFIDDYGLIDDNFEDEEIVSKTFRKSIDALAQFKEDYLNGKYV